ncbi:MAG: LptA/OstA family protein [Pseudomonadota bacterium]
MKKHISPVLFAAFELLATGAAHAEKADIGKHIKIVADTMTKTPGSDKGVKEVLTAAGGGATLSKGSFTVSGETIVVTTYQNGREEVHVSSPNGPATMQQKREGSSLRTEGEARNIYLVIDSKTAVAELREHAKIRHLDGGNTTDESAGDGISYDILTEAVTVRGASSPLGRPLGPLTSMLPNHQSQHPQIES